MNSNNSLYFYLILYFIFALFHKTIALFILFKISIVHVRYLFNIIEPFFIICFFLFFKLSTEIKIILGIFFLAPLNFWVCDEGFIYNFIDNTPENNKIVNNIGLYGDMFINIFVFAYVVYFLKTLFA